MERLANTGPFKKSTRNLKKNYFRSITTYVRNSVRECEICIQGKRINNTRIAPELVHIPEWDLAPKHLMQIDLLPELSANGGYENIIIAIDVFSRYCCLSSFQPHHHNISTCVNTRELSYVNVNGFFSMTS